MYTIGVHLFGSSISGMRMGVGNEKSFLTFVVVVNLSVEHLIASFTT
jgi:hypothetical protein